MRSATVPHYGFADDPYTCAWHNCGQTIHLEYVVTLERERFHVLCWNERVAFLIREWEGEVR